MMQASEQAGRANGRIRPAPARNQHGPKSEYGLLRRSTSRMFATTTHVILGSVLGILILHPSAMLVSWLDHGANGQDWWRFVVRMWNPLRPTMLAMTGAFALLGAAVGLAFACYYRLLHKRERAVEGLARELARDVGSIIAGGENEQVEFKATARWDLRHQKVSKTMEVMIAKTLAAFLNHEGGSLFIGIHDDGSITGLQYDYATLKHGDRDGFQQFVMTLAKHRLGGDVCALIHLSIAEIGEHDICRIIIEPAHRPVYVQDGGAAHYFVRTGSISRELDVAEAIQHIALRWPGRAGVRARVRKLGGAV